MQLHDNVDEAEQALILVMVKQAEKSALSANLFLQLTTVQMFCDLFGLELAHDVISTAIAVSHYCRPDYKIIDPNDKGGRHAKILIRT
jgi:hypothetical protein